MEWGYIPAGTSLEHPKLSPKFASLNCLSEWISVVGAECDVLCAEAGEMVAKWLGEEYGENGRDVMSGKNGKIRWVLAKGQKHSYGRSLDFKRIIPPSAMSQQCIRVGHTLFRHYIGHEASQKKTY
jgi:hypothetical protein